MSTITTFSLEKKFFEPLQGQYDFQEYAVILAAHGDRGGKAPNTKLISHRDALSKIANFRVVTAGVLKGDPTLEDAVLGALQSGARSLLLYPLFMADGYFNKTVLPQRLAALNPLEHLRILPPLGQDQRLPNFLLSHAVNTAQQHNIDPKTARLLIVGHGSQLGPASSISTKTVAKRINQEGIFYSVETAFLEEDEFLEDALLRSTSNTIVLGFFSGDGMHAGDDVPELIASTGSKAIYAGSLGSLPQLANFLLTSIASVLVDNALKDE